MKPWKFAKNQGITSLILQTNKPIPTLELSLKLLFCFIYIYIYIVHCFSSYLFYALIPFIEHFLKHVVSCTDIYIYIYTHNVKCWHLKELNFDVQVLKKAVAIFT